MADDYTVELEGHVFTASPALTFVGERGHRLDEHPVTHRFTDYTIELGGCRVPTGDGTPGGAATALGTFLTSTVHKIGVPSYLKIKDAAGVVIPEFGDINTATTGWEELKVFRFTMPPGVAQLRAGAEFGLILTVRRTFADANGMVMLERSWSEEAGPDGLIARTQRTTITMRRGTPVPTTVAWVLALVRLAKPAGWGRTIGNTTLGASINYPFFPQFHVAEFVSQVAQLGGGFVPPDGAGDGTEGEQLRDVAELGLVEVTHFAEATGASDPDTFLAGHVPLGAVGEQTIDRGHKVARGSWKTWQAPSQTLGGKVTRVEVARSFVPGGAGYAEKAVSGNHLPLFAKGPVRAWRLREVIRLYALGVIEWADLPTLPLLSDPWRYDPTSGSEEPARLVRRGSIAAQHLWERVSTRDYLWTGEGDPTELVATRAFLLRRYEVGEEGLVLR